MLAFHGWRAVERAAAFHAFAAGARGEPVVIVAVPIPVPPPAAEIEIELAGWPGELGEGC